MLNIKCKWILFFIFSIFDSAVLFSQWQVIDSIKYPLSQTRIVDIKSPNGKDVIAIANIRVQAPCMAKSQDSGKTWQIKYLDTIDGHYHLSSLVNELAYPDTNLAIAVGDSGYYFRSTDNGETWKKHRINNKNKNWHVNFWNSKIGIIEQYRFDGDNVLFNRLKTTDGGLTWFDVAIPNRYDSLAATGLHFFKGGIGYSIELSWLPGDSAFYIHKSTDYGETWSSYKSAEYPPSGSFYFVNENLGFCLGSSSVIWNEPDNKYIRKTTDAGKTWKVVFDTSYIPMDGVANMHFFDTLNGVASTYGSVIRTTNGGDSWFVDTTYSYTKFKYGMHMAIMIDKDKSLGIASWNWPYIYRYTAAKVTSIKHDDIVFKGKIFPNPATDYITINLSYINPTLKRGVEGDVVVEIYDVMGVKIQSTPSASQPPLKRGIKDKSISLIPLCLL